MGNILADLLSAQEPEFSATIRKLERASGNPSVDVRLMSEIIQSVRTKTNELGLDSSDSTGQELYYALLNKAKIHDAHLAKHIGVSDKYSVDKIADSIKRVVEKSKTNINSWSIRKSVAKRLLQQMPPEKVMKYLNYSSIDSMIKRENLAEIFGAIRLIETNAWLRRFNKLYKQLSPSDFEDRKIEFLVMPSERWSHLSEDLYKKREYSLTHLKELGFIVIFAPRSQKLEGYTLSTLPLALHYINEIRLYSAFFKLQQVKSDFGNIIVRTLNEDDVYDIEISGKKIHWRIVQRYYGQPGRGNHPDVFQPHIQPDDLYWSRSEDSLYAMNPELSFWKGLDYAGVLLRSNRPISFNVLDVSMNYYFAIDYEDRVYKHMQTSLWNELYMRYIDQRVFESQIQNQLSSGVIDPEFLRF